MKRHFKLFALATLSLIFLSNTNLYSSNQPSDKERVTIDRNSLTIPKGYTQNLKWDLPLDSIGKNGSKIKWESNKPEYISNDGKLLRLSPRKGKKVTVKMKATVAAGEQKKTKSFNVLIAHEEPIYDGYLFAYFEGTGENETQEQLRYAASADAVNWKALNNNQPIIPSDKISNTGGVRDPHILRGEDEKSFYMVATDMYTKKNGWGHNPGIVLMKSEDLINWTHGIVDLEKDYPEQFPNIQWVWAPQTIYDPSADKYLVYFTVKFKNDSKLDFYCAYANNNFNGLESAPLLMFSAKDGAIDGDIIYKDGTYHFFFKGNTKDENGKEIDNGIKQAVGKSLQGPWTEKFDYLDVYHGTRTNVEGSSVFKLNNSDTYILMYDLYGRKRYEFQRSTNLYDFTTKAEVFTKDFYPRHGSVISITKEEAIRLNNKWGGVPNELLTPNK